MAYFAAGCAIIWYVGFALLAARLPLLSGTGLRVLAIAPFAALWILTFNNEFNDRLMGVTSIVVVLAAIAIPGNALRRKGGDG